MNALEVVDWVIREEGGVGDALDGKGLTKWGQTPAWLEQFHLPSPSTREEAARNYLYWIDLVGLGPIFGPDDDLPLVVVDYAVHAGHPTAIKALQRAIGAAPDGVVGKDTIAALAGANRLVVAFRVLIDRMEQGGSVISAIPARARDAKGWTRRWGRQFRRLVAAIPVGVV